MQGIVYPPAFSEYRPARRHCGTEVLTVSNCAWRPGSKDLLKPGSNLLRIYALHEKTAQHLSWNCELVAVTGQRPDGAFSGAVSLNKLSPSLLSCGAIPSLPTGCRQVIIEGKAEA